MEYVRLQHKEDELLEKMLNRSRDERVHPTLTDLIYCLTKASYVELMEKKDSLKYSRQTSLYFVLGLGLERALLGTDREAPVGEKDGIQYHLDEMDMDELLELKTTRMKPNDDEPVLTDSWLRQMKGYLYAEGLTEINFCTLHLIQPDIRVWRIRFTEEELEENWNWLLERKMIYEEFRDKNEIPTPYAYNEEWECKGCQFAMQCEAVSLRNKILASDVEMTT